MSEREYVCNEMSKREVYDQLSLNPRRSIGLHPESRQVIVYTASVGPGDRSLRRATATELFGRPITRRQTLAKLYAIGRCSDPYETKHLIESLLSDMAGGD